MAVSCVLPSLRNALLLFLKPSEHPKNLLELGAPSPTWNIPAALGEMSPALSFALSCSWSLAGFGAFPSALGPVSILLLPCLLPIPPGDWGTEGRTRLAPELAHAKIPKIPKITVMGGRITQGSVRDHSGISQ